MENEKDTIIFRLSWAKVIRTLPPETQIEVYNAICDYASGEETGKLSPLAEVAFGFIKSDIDRNSDKYAKTCERRREAGRRGNAKRWSEEKADAEPVVSALSADSENRKCDNSDESYRKNRNCDICDNTDTENRNCDICDNSIAKHRKHRYNDNDSDSDNDCDSDSDSDSDNDNENNKKDKSFFCYSLTPNPFEGASEKEKQKNSLTRVFFFRNFRDPTGQAVKFLAFNNTGKRRWAKMDETQRQSCLDLWQPQGADGKPQENDRMNPDDLQWWGEVYSRMAESGAPQAVMLAAVDDAIAMTVRNDGAFYLAVPRAVYEYLERHLDIFKPLLQNALDRKKCRSLHYTFTDK